MSEPNFSRFLGWILGVISNLFHILSTEIFIRAIGMFFSIYAMIKTTAMHILSDMLKPFATLLSKDPVSKKDFVKIAHEKAHANQKKLLSLLQMLQFSQAYREGEDLVLE